MASSENSGFKYRGLAVVIVNKEFPDSSKSMKRRGATKDLKMMKTLFLMLDFKVKAYFNKKSDEIRAILDKAKTWKFDYKPQCFVCVISSHGEEVPYNQKSKRGTPQGPVYKPSILGTDKIGVTTEDIVNKFTDENCELYRGKPKLFFIQACRGRTSPATWPGQKPTIKDTDCYDPGVKLEVLMNKLALGPGGKPEGGQDVSDCAGNQETGDGGQTEETTENLLSEEEELEIQQLLLLENEAVDKDEWNGEMSDSEDEEEETPEEKQEVPVTSGGDQADTKPKSDAAGQDMIPVPHEVVAMEIPQNCLMMVPVMSGKIAFRNAAKGSWLLYHMYQNKQLLFEKSTLLRYLTHVCGAMSNYEFNPDEKDKMSPELRAMLPSKMCACIMHRLTDVLTFEPQGEKSLMQKFKQKLAIWATDRCLE